MEQVDVGLWGVLIAILGGAIRVSTPFIFVSLGELLTERSGRFNLGLEGTLVFGAMSGYAVAYETNSAFVGVLAAAAAGADVVVVTAPFGKRCAAGRWCAECSPCRSPTTPECSARSSLSCCDDH